MYEDQLTDDVKNIESNFTRPHINKEAKLAEDNSGVVTERESTKITERFRHVQSSDDF